MDQSSVKKKATVLKNGQYPFSISEGISGQEPQLPELDTWYLSA